MGENVCESCVWLSINIQYMYNKSIKLNNPKAHNLIKNEERNWTIYFQRKHTNGHRVYSMLNITNQEKCKLKPLTLHLLERLLSSKARDNKCWCGCREKGTLCTIVDQISTATMESSIEVPWKVKIESLCDPKISEYISCMYIQRKWNQDLHS